MKISRMAEPYLAVCGKCNMPLQKHPVENCPYIYEPIAHDGRVYGYRMLDKKNKNGKTEKEKSAT